MSSESHKRQYCQVSATSDAGNAYIDQVHGTEGQAEVGNSEDVFHLPSVQSRPHKRNRRRGKAGAKGKQRKEPTFNRRLIKR